MYGVVCFMEVVTYLKASSGGTAFPEDKALHWDLSWESCERYNGILSGLDQRLPHGQIGTWERKVLTGDP